MLIKIFIDVCWLDTYTSIHNQSISVSRIIFCINESERKIKSFYNTHEKQFCLGGGIYFLSYWVFILLDIIEFLLLHFWLLKEHFILEKICIKKYGVDLPFFHMRIPTIFCWNKTGIVPLHIASSYRMNLGNYKFSCLQ